MDGSDQDDETYGMKDRGDERTFRVKFSANGAEELREIVNDKLKEFMGDYTDDTLVEYVIVLLRNGRHKEGARNELNVFLGDDTDSFVSWLWDHLSSNLHLYVQPEESNLDEMPKSKSMLEEETKFNDSNMLDSEREKSTRESKIRRNREWKGLVRDVAEPPPLRSSEVENFNLEKTHSKLARVKRPRSPLPSVQNKRNQQYERKEIKREVPREVPTKLKLDAPRRLLQSAVRDALGSSLRSPSLNTEPALKRLRSVVSTSTGESISNNQSHKMRSAVRVPSSMVTAIKAAAAAAEDVTMFGDTGNVFDRLGHGMQKSRLNNPASGYETAIVEDEGIEDFVNRPDTDHFDYLQSEDIEEFAGNTAILDRDTDISYDYASDNEGYNGIEVAGSRAVDAYHSASSYGNKDDDSLMVQYSVAKNTDDLTRRKWVRDQNPSPAAANTSGKIVNISVNVNTWKPPHYQAPQEVKEVENHRRVQESEAAASKLGVRIIKENSAKLGVKENEKVGHDMHKETQPILPSTAGSYSILRPSDDADSRTIFINNVHFAATKDTLSRHFSKFGEVVKVVIVTDAATGQPKGSAYIEFVRKEVAELALSLNGTSFMSRILKVARKGSAYQEVAPVMSWPRAAWVSPFAARLNRVPFTRGQTAFRGRLPIKTGARSLQWKRGAPASPATEGSVNGQNGASLPASNVPSPTARSLTYVRTEAKPVGNSGPT